MKYRDFQRIISKKKALPKGEVKLPSLLDGKNLGSSDEHMMVCEKRGMARLE